MKVRMAMLAYDTTVAFIRQWSGPLLDDFDVLGGMV
jgi:hypothetical protein